MSGLVQDITNRQDAAYGVNILEVTPQPSVKTVSTSVVGIAGILPWGPEGEITTWTNRAELHAAFYPDDLATAKDYEAYPAILALINKRLSTRTGARFVRVAATGAAKSTSGGLTAGDGTVTITAKHKGVIGDSISRQFVAATDADAAKRDLIITTTAGYSARYTNLTTTTVVLVSNPYVDIAATGATAMPAVDASPVALSSGSDGTTVATDVLSAAELYAGEASDADTIFVAECPSGLLDAVNAGLKLIADEGGPLVILCTKAGQTAAEAITYIDTYRSTNGNSGYFWPRVQTPNVYDSARATVTVDGNAFAAACIANVPAWESPGGNGKSQGGVDLLSGIVGLEDESAKRGTLELLNAAGIAPFAKIAGIGFIIRRAVSTALTGRTKLKSRRYYKYLSESIAALYALYVERPLDLSLEAEQLGTYTDAATHAVETFLQAEKDDKHLQSYSVDPFSLNTQAAIDAGTWETAIQAKTYADQDVIILSFAVGTSVTITDQ